ncbi:hypothetical protein ASPZODRAFT_131066 [Penicilliopsis zonata CBS 506.65]|uniref:Uncharacterized protein n=1 Tax=Penicilliopsis zonata CBS 506.65 TaxID=1073090 RepID=A0A1L9SKC0_9EURO|nr:hypothetical protein ASPZODRAFT_131066 [Penicilliopsis zonata CBS 506.65]OJJ47543.1 hypothetical protein ASPZODRAFT_131066 [Penicilliopsis zonata CBS 506.65]
MGIPAWVSDEELETKESQPSSLSSRQICGENKEIHWISPHFSKQLCQGSPDIEARYRAIEVISRA